jgi:hypothetical protein
MVYKQIRINITKPQLLKAMAGKPVKFTNAQIGKGNTFLSLHPANAKIVEKASIKGNGCILNLTEGELLATAEDMNGEGIFGDIWKGLKSAYKWAKKNVIDSSLYQQALKPLVREAVNTGKTALKAYAPKLAPVVDAVADKIGDETGAFGVRRGVRMGKKTRSELLKAKGLYLS